MSKPPSRTGFLLRLFAPFRRSTTAEWLFPDPTNVAVLTTCSIIHGGAWIAHVSHSGDDGDWQFHDSEPGAPREEDAMVVSLHSMVTRDGTLNQLADLPEGWRAWRSGPAAPWQRGRVG